MLEITRAVRRTFPCAGRRRRRHDAWIHGRPASACCKLLDRGPGRDARHPSRPSPGSTRRWPCRCAAASTPRVVVYDCMDELSAFKRCAAGSCSSCERELLKARRRGVHRRAEPVPGEADAHPNVHCFPSSVERAHFAQAHDRDARSPRTRRPAAPAARLLRRHRRALRLPTRSRGWPTRTRSGSSCWSARW